MSKTFKFKRKYYDGRMIFKRGSATIDPGVTVLVGCNGAGKSTLQHIMKSQLKAENISYITYDNERDGGYFARQYQMDFGSAFDAISMCLSSEGENISINLYNQAEEIGKYIKTGQSKSASPSPFTDLFNTVAHPAGQVVEHTCNERWIFFDAVDSGYSIDNIIELKALLDMILIDCSKRGLECYIILSANSYEMCTRYPCYDVINCKYVEFMSYQDYKDFILRSRVSKDKSIEKYAEASNQSE